MHCPCAITFSSRRKFSSGKRASKVYSEWLCKMSQALGLKPSVKCSDEIDFLLFRVDLRFR